jgi:hypothetical protein
MMGKNNLISRISILQYEITSEVLKGHKSNDCDKFKDNRKELMELRCKSFGEDSKICKSERSNYRKCGK